MPTKQQPVVASQQVGTYYVVQLLEGPTDNPIRVISGWGNSYTFGIEGTGWNILTELLAGDSTPLFKEESLKHLVELASRFPENMGSTNCYAISI